MLAAHSKRSKVDGRPQPIPSSPSDRNADGETASVVWFVNLAQGLECRPTLTCTGRAIVRNLVPSDKTRTAPDEPERHRVVRLSFECSSGERTPDVPGFSSGKTTIRPQRSVSEVPVQASVRAFNTAGPARSRFLWQSLILTATNMANQSPSSGKVTKSLRQVKLRVPVQLQVRMRRPSRSFMRASCHRRQTNFSKYWCRRSVFDFSNMRHPTVPVVRPCRGQGEGCRSGVEATVQERGELYESNRHISQSSPCLG